VRWRSAAAAALTAIALAGCGGDEPRSAGGRDGVTADDAFVVRLYAQQQASAELLRQARSRVRARPAKRLVVPMTELRKQTLARLEPHRKEVGAPAELADLGVSREQAAEDVTPASLKGVKPLDPAFLATMARLDDGATALAKAELARGRDPAIKDLARRLIVDLARESGRIDAAIAALQQTA
jgi:uncharacterized protein (DUF305 family)